MMHLQLRHELDLEVYLEPSVVALTDGSIRALNRAASQLLAPGHAATSLLDICASRVDALRTYLLACSGSRQPLIERVSFTGSDGAGDYRCFGNVLVPRRKSQPATLLLRFFPLLDPRFSAVAERLRRLTAERQRRLAMQQFDELRSDRLRLVEQYCFVAEALRVVEARTHQLQDELNHIRTDERERIARDLHDHAGQEMAQVLVELRVLQESTKGLAKRRIEEIVEHVAGVGRKIHHAVISGRPRIVEELGFSRAIEAMATSFAADGRLNLCFRKKGPEPDPMPAVIEDALYRVAQEALTNTLKHALGARKLDVVLDFASTSVSLTIADDGAGLRSQPERPGDGIHTGIGLHGMRQRMADLGGTLGIGPRCGKGTIVTAVAPLTGVAPRSVPS
ncbi:Histidine kinase-, DNA gyrase B-, and HSP90-like ATPase [Bosea sp. 62]|uniref:sensor histidine kinase n=2 Tax=unclassified Bosea (in: a-proteobacteria) TaxID=2653178 RepID=UPI0012551CD1|nr:MULTISPECIES: ATP-binding protein [unclassified Bosea (in: a-proteobacteria)]CAD5261221.1 Histidine kinase-, DNA gyrase B-, and HSP90-like ATPase [Bosea sp. 21B]VXC45837.1 Histidine kinase-, DNA gyrase B-, and HSP90-like ATPase [Bosea sp. 62]CAD5256816.1 Histidine kinase-, DNA gyrase B-, and HSP90-like ATPase [Bosea sp. 46]CAD5279407.1 Histidine kinase-, DNA gyrase B-, and HSP90-like ATPase [Bosea sp. 7B]VVT58423.1 Histidine kinase-, DNA gyrase B-, and HSP90-like ATPase [Bosea sp. EC-HK365B